MSKTITAFFEHYADAAEAVARLEAAGVPHRDISLIANNEGDRYSSHAKRTFDGTNHDDHDETHADDGAGTGATLGTLAGGGAGLLAGLGMLAVPGLGPVVAAGWLVSTLVGAGAGAAIGGLAGSLVGAGIPEHDAHAYAEGVRRGGALVTVRATDTEVDRIIDILDDEGTVDLDERQSAWRSDGWTGSTGSMAAGGSSGLTAAGPGGAGSAGASRTSRTAGERDEVIPIAAEELHVGKREVNRGRVRINSHVVERPVQEQVTLRQENVHVERRAVEGAARTGAASGDALFQERTIEMEEKREEAVVSKEARVKEELVIKKDVEQRTETISDTVRSTEVTVEDERGNRVSGTDKTDRKF